MLDPFPTTSDLIDHRAAATRLGCKRAKFFRDVRGGLVTQPIRLHAHAIRWPASDIDRIVRARLIGACDDDIRALVATLELTRRHALKSEGFVQ